jgi:hypothetical protein
VPVDRWERERVSGGRAAVACEREVEEVRCPLDRFPAAEIRSHLTPSPRGFVPSILDRAANILRYPFATAVL